jgi:hypothetical protein
METLPPCVATSSTTSKVGHVRQLKRCNELECQPEIPFLHSSETADFEQHSATHLGAGGDYQIGSTAAQGVLQPSVSPFATNPAPSCVTLCPAQWT